MTDGRTTGTTTQAQGPQAAQGPRSGRGSAGSAAPAPVRALRRHLGVGRLLPLGGPLDGAWITEEAAAAVLTDAAAALPGVRLDGVRLALAEPESAGEPVVPPPPSALPPGPLRITAEFAATADEPLPEAADRLRAVLADAAAARLGLLVFALDLHATALLDEPPRPGPASRPSPPPARDTGEAAAAAALAVPGVTGLTAVLGRTVGAAERRAGAASAGAGALPREHLRLEITVNAARPASEVAVEVRGAVSEAVPGHPTVAVLVTRVD